MQAMHTLKMGRSTTHTASHTAPHLQLGRTRTRSLHFLNFSPLILHSDTALSFILLVL